MDKHKHAQRVNHPSARQRLWGATLAEIEKTHVFFQLVDAEEYLSPPAVRSDFLRRMAAAWAAPRTFFPNHAVLNATTYALAQKDWMDVAAALCRQMGVALTHEVNDLCRHALCPGARSFKESFRHTRLGVALAVMWWSAIALDLLRKRASAELREMIAAGAVSPDMVLYILAELSAEDAAPQLSRVHFFASTWSKDTKAFAQAQRRAAAMASFPCARPPPVFACAAAVDLLDALMDAAAFDINQDKDEGEYYTDEEEDSNVYFRHDYAHHRAFLRGETIREIVRTATDKSNLAMLQFLFWRKNRNPARDLLTSGGLFCYDIIRRTLCAFRIGDSESFTAVWGANGVVARVVRELHVLDVAIFWHVHMGAPLPSAHDAVPDFRLTDLALPVICAFAVVFKVHAFITEASDAPFDFRCYTGWDRAALLSCAPKIHDEIVTDMRAWAQKESSAESVAEIQALEDHTVDRWAREWKHAIVTFPQLTLLNGLAYHCFDPLFVQRVKLEHRLSVSRCITAICGSSKHLI